MTDKSIKSRIIHVILIFLVLINILGDIGNIIIWYAVPGVPISYVFPVYIESIILAIVATIYAIALYGVIKKDKWGSLLVITISIVNRIIALFIFIMNPAFFVWAVWTVILLIFAYLEYRQIKPQA